MDELDKKVKILAMLAYERGCRDEKPKNVNELIKWLEKSWKNLEVLT